MELDVYFPDISLAFEYQGRQHYQNVFQGGWAMQQTRDREKREACQQHHITLVLVPYWWNGESLSLAATIAQHRPDVIAHLNNK